MHNMGIKSKPQGQMFKLGTRHNKKAGLSKTGGTNRTYYINRYQTSVIIALIILYYTRVTMPCICIRAPCICIRAHRKCALPVPSAGSGNDTKISLTETMIIYTLNTC